MSSPDSTDPQARFTMVGPWVEFDPADPLAGTSLATHGAALVAAGLVAPRTANARLLIAATLIEPSEEANGIPLVASALVHEHVGAVAGAFEGDAVVPDRRVRRRTVTWPGDIGDVQLHEVSYLIPHPDLPRYITFVFASPNLAAAAELEWLFDSIVGSFVWI